MTPHCWLLTLLLSFVCLSVIYLQSKLIKILKNPNDGFIPFKTQLPIYYINLDRSTERRNYMEKAFNNAGKLIRVSAIDGNSDSLKDYVGGGDLEHAVIAGKCSRNELALAASHMRAIKEAHDSGASAALIMEDDVSPMAAPFWTIGLDELVGVANEEKPGWELIRLQHSIVTRSRRKAALRGWRENPFQHFVVKNYIAYGMAAYLISKAGMRFLVERFIDEEGKFDCLRRQKFRDGSCVADFLFPKELNKVFLTSPPMFVTRIFEDSTGVRTDSLGEVVNDQWRVHYQSALDSLSWIVEAHEIKEYSSDPAKLAEGFPLVVWNLAKDTSEDI